MKKLALAVSLAEFVISLFLIRGFVTANPGYQFEEIHPWIGSAIRYHMGVDGISLFLVAGEGLGAVGRRPDCSGGNSAPDEPVAASPGPSSRAWKHSYSAANAANLQKPTAP